MNNEDEKKSEYPIVERLVESLTSYYSPAKNPSEADESKTTQELIEEMEQIQDSIYPWEVNRLMEQKGFIMNYTGSGYVWLLKVIGE